ncbi:response regulator [Leeia sp. TBRC 13508]|uniref:Response regulator n=1 Tax=Leeia speluncae TaxID=2884804 RepID=A0ABS8D6P2_9NEIS|nr:response regulator [Leeia speluncae]MCB6183846.1 response regulator [Leeia speluncae]
MRILLAEDDALLGDGIAAVLRETGLVVDWLDDGVKAESALLTTDYELVVLDIGLPRQDGLSVLRKLRSKGSDIPVLLLTARDSIEDRVAGLEAGADDYLIKPFAMEELQARVRALMRRAHGRATPEIRVGDLRVDPASRQVWKAEELVVLSGKEFALLIDLLEHKGTARSREQLEDSLYGFGEEVGSNAVEVHIHHLRKKLGEQFIRTMRGVGYVIA